MEVILKTAISEYLSKARLMQVATTAGNQPWVCTVYFVEDEELNLYWLSLPTRRHSIELDGNKNIAAAIAVKHDQPIIGIQAEGFAGIVDDVESVRRIMKYYTKKYNTGFDFLSNFQKGTNQHHLYKLTPKRIVLIDEVKYPDDPRRELEM